MKNPEIVFYSFGSGLGHLTRTCSIVRKLRKLASCRISVLTNSPFHKLFDEMPVEFIDSTSLSTDLCKRRIWDYFGAMRPGTIVVDSFPRGIAGELPPILSARNIRKILVRRILKEDYIEKFQIEDFIASHYDAVIHAEPIPDSRSPGMECCPILIRDYEELRGEEASKRLLNADIHDKVIIASTTGDDQLVEGFHRAVTRAFERIEARGFCLRLVSPLSRAMHSNCHIRYFPLLELLPGADILLGPCGYNLYHESMALSIPSIFLPGDRLYDDQGMRAGSSAVAAESLDQRLAELIRQVNARGVTRTSYVNMAESAAKLIVEAAGL